MKTYKIPISWESYKRIEVQADNLQDAILKAVKQFLAVPDDLYLEDSFVVDKVIFEEYPDEDANLVEIFNKL